MIKFFPILLYLGPETIMPLGSVLAAIIGLILIFWRFIAGSIRKIFYRLTGRSTKNPDLEGQTEEIQNEPR